MSMPGVRPFSIALSVVATALLLSGAGSHGRALITQPINENRLRTLAGNTRPEVKTATDSGAVPDNFVMDHMMVQLQRAPEQEQSVRQFIDELHSPQSPNFHRWLTPAEFGQKYGASEQDISTVTTWLRSHGLAVNAVYPSGMLIDVSG